MPSACRPARLPSGSCETNPFLAGQDPWLDRLGNLRNVVRQEVVARQLAAHLPRAAGHACSTSAPARAPRRCASPRLGHVVTAVEPDERMRAAFDRAPPGSRPVRAGPGHAPRRRPRPVWRGATQLGEPTTSCSATGCSCTSPRADRRSGARPTGRARRRPVGRWRATVTRWPGGRPHGTTGRPRSGCSTRVDAARAEGRDALYRNEIGVDARADTLESLMSSCAEAGLEVEAWCGVRVASDDVAVDEPAPAGRRAGGPPRRRGAAGRHRPLPRTRHPPPRHRATPTRPTTSLPP